MSRTPTHSPDNQTSAGVTIKSKPVRVQGKIEAQRVIRELPGGRLESATYPLYPVSREEAS